MTKIDDDRSTDVTDGEPSEAFLCLPKNIKAAVRNSVTRAVILDEINRLNSTNNDEADFARRKTEAEACRITRTQTECSTWLASAPDSVTTGHNVTVGNTVDPDDYEGKELAVGIYIDGEPFGDVYGPSDSSQPGRQLFLFNLINLLESRNIPAKSAMADVIRDSNAAPVDIDDVTAAEIVRQGIIIEDNALRVPGQFGLQPFGDRGVEFTCDPQDHTVIRIEFDGEDEDTDRFYIIKNGKIESVVN